jgi:hypothetical protein
MQPGGTFKARKNSEVPHHYSIRWMQSGKTGKNKSAA